MKPYNNPIVLLFLLLLPLASAQVWDKDVKLYYSFNSNSSTFIANDRGETAYNLTRNNNPEFLNDSNCLEGGCFNLSGTSYFRDATSIDLNDYENSFGFCTWVYGYQHEAADKDIVIWFSEGSGSEMFLRCDEGANIEYRFGWLTDEISTCTSMAWYHWCVAKNYSSKRFWLNGIAYLNTSSTNATDISADLIIGSTITDNYLNALIDEMIFTNKTGGLSQEDVEQLYNNGLGSFYPFGNPTTDSGVITWFINNKSGDVKTTFDEGEDFHVKLNYTFALNNSIVRNASCSVNMSEAVRSDIGIGNFTLCASGCSYDEYEESATLSTANAINDSVHFVACHTQGVSKNLKITQHCNSGAVTDVFTIDKSRIPLCSGSPTEQFIYFDSCLAFADVSYNFSNTAMVYTTGHTLENVEIDREYSFIVEAMPFNSTIDLYEAPAWNEYYKHGSKSLKAVCDYHENEIDKNSTQALTIVNAAPVIEFSQVLAGGVLQNLTNNTVMEFYAGSWQFYISIIDDDLDVINITFRNSSGDFKNFTSTSNVIVSSAYFVDFDAMPFVILVSASDSFGAVSNLTFTFNFSDTGAPQAKGINNLSINNGTTITHNVTFSDENFFSFNVSCNDGFSYNLTGLNVQSYNYLQAHTITQNTTCQWQYCDGHTDVLRRNWDIVRQDSIIEFRIDNTEKVVLRSLLNASVEYERKTDRISFTYDFGFSLDNVREYIFILETSQNSYYFQSTKYPAWIVDNDKKLWFDMAGADSAKVYRINETAWEIRVSTRLNSITFDSIGELNCEKETQFIAVTLPPAALADTILQLNKCPTTGAGMASMIFSFVIVFFLIILNWALIKLPIMTVIGGVAVLFLSFYYLGCNQVISLFIMFFGLICIFKGILEAW